MKDGVDITGATGSGTHAQFTKPNVGALDAGSYKVTFSNANGSADTNSAIVTVTGVRPVITTQPTATTVAEGGTLSLTAAGSGYSSWKWMKGNANIVGATGTGGAISLSLDLVGPANAGNYKVVLTNATGATTSSLATVTITPAAVKPVITTQPLSGEVSTGTTLSLTSAGTGIDSWKWKKDGVDIPGASGDRGPITFTKANTAAGDAGSYVVVLSNSKGSTTSSAAVITVKKGG